jgi:hypothetical protein
MVLFLGAFAKLRKTSICFVMSLSMPVRQHATNRLPLDGFSWNLVSENFRKSVTKMQVWANVTRITGTLHEDLCTFMIISRWILLRMRNISDKSFTENQNTHFIFNNFFRKSYRLCYTVEKYGRVGQATDDNTIRRMRFPCHTTKARIQTHVRNI